MNDIDNGGCVNGAFDVNIALQEDNNTSASSISLAWRNLSYHVTEFGGLKFKRKVILHQLTGHFTNGTLGCLMGPSGAGKTSLLNCLSGTACSGLAAHSEIYLGGQRAQSAVSYYIRQHVQESIVGELTVGQILRYAFAFKNGRRGGEEVARHLEATMAALMLPAELESRPFGKCSGGEQKRVAIAQELMSLTAPSFLFVDEPTTGLDSSSAYQVMYCLKQLAVNHRITVIASIHAPNDETLQLFNKLYVLAKGGVCIYSGPPAAIQCQLEQRIDLKIAEDQPPIEALMKIACNGTANSTVILLANETLATENAELTPCLSTLTSTPNGLPSSPKYFSLGDFFTQLPRLFRITFLAKYRSFLFMPVIFLLYFSELASIFSSEMTTESGCINYVNATKKCKNKDPLEYVDLVKENENYIIFTVIMIGYITLLSTTALYATHIKMFMNEHRNHWYSLGVFYFSSTLVSLVELSLIAFWVGSLSYFLVQQHAIDDYSLNWTRLGFYYLFVWLLALYYQVTGQLIVVIFVNQPLVAILLCQLLFTVFQLFNGLFVKLDRTGIAVLEYANDWIGMVYITRGVFYSIFGIDRCDFATQFSTIMLDHNVQVERIGEYVLRIVLNVTALKVLALLIMYIRFNSFGGKRKAVKGDQTKSSISIDEKSVELVQLKTAPSEIKQNEDEAQFNEFSRHKILIAWRNLSLLGSSPFFEIGFKSSQNVQVILRHLKGELCFGTLAGLMGTSGAGKTSLLRVLNGQCKSRLSSDTAVYLSKYTKINTCFITQEVSGHLISGLTAKQMVVCASRLKNSQANVDHEQIALKWLQELDLLNTVDTRVENCSGGERKRLAVALELTAIEMPNLICIDEPTSGLDSNSAEIVISTLRKLTFTHPLTIVTSIHQPTTEVLHLFDQLYVLARGGVCIYAGPPRQIQAHLNRLPDVAQHSGHFPIETLITHSCSSHQDPLVQHLSQLNDQQFASNDSTERLSAETQLVPDGVVANRPRFSFHSILNLGYRYLLYIRGYLWIQWLVYFVVSFFFAINLRFLYSVRIIHSNGCVNVEDDLTQCHKTAKEIQDEFDLTDNLSYNYFLTNIYMFLILISSSVNMASELPIFSNEHRNGWYSTGSFYLTKSLVEIVPVIVTNFLYVYILDIYDPIVPGGIYWPLFWTLTITQTACLAYGHCFCLLGRSQVINITIILAAVYTLFLAISNTYVPYVRLHYFWQLVSNFATPRFFFETIMLVQYGFGRCTSKQVNVVLYSMSLKDEDYYPNIGMLIFIAAFFRLVAFCLLLRQVSPVDNRRKRVNRIAEYQESLKQLAK